MQFKRFDARSLLAVISIVFLNTGHALPNFQLTNTLSFLVGNEQDFRSEDHATYLTTGGELNNFILFDNDFYVEADNLLSFGPFGDYYISNEYSVDSTYPTKMYKYVARLTAGKVFCFCNNSRLTLGIGGGYRYLHYSARYFENNITYAELRYIDWFIPVEINYSMLLAGDYYLVFNNILNFSAHGKMNHFFKGPGGFNQPSFHNVLGITSEILLNYKQFSFGPYGAYDYFTIGFFNGHPTVATGNEVKIVEFGLKFNYSF